MKIAIKPNPRRGKEIISLLESLGGINDELKGDGRLDNYYIDKNNRIQYAPAPKDYKVYTLEEFEKEFPFKIGDRVISITTNFIGIITELKENGCYYVKYDNGNFACTFGQNLKLYKEMKRNITLTLDKAKEWYKKGGELREIALQAFTEKELNPRPRSWEEFSYKYKVSDMRYAMPFKYAALWKLEQLRDCWWNGWKPDWNDYQQTKYCVVYYRGEFKISIRYETMRFLSFPTIEMAEEFLECFRDLIEKAGDLI